MDWEQIKTIISTLVSAGTVMLAIARWLRRKMKEMIQREIGFVAIQLGEIKEQQKILSERQDSIHRTLQKVVAAYNENQRETVKFDEELRTVLYQNTELLKELANVKDTTITKAEQISPNLVKLAGKKS